MAACWPNAPHWHLILNHFPIVGFACAFLVLLLSEFSSCSAWRKVGWFLAIFSGAMLIPVFETGEHAAPIVRKLIDISKGQIHVHYHYAVLSVWTASITAGLALLAFLAEGIKKMCLARPFRLIILLGVFASLAFFGFTAYNGALIHHPEIELGNPLPKSVP